jgi:hypothetical protein
VFGLDGLQLCILVPEVDLGSVVPFDLGFFRNNNRLAPIKLLLDAQECSPKLP